MIQVSGSHYRILKYFPQSTLHVITLLTIQFYYDIVLLSQYNAVLKITVNQTLFILHYHYKRLKII